MSMKNRGAGRPIRGFWYFGLSVVFYLYFRYRHRLLVAMVLLMGRHYQV